MLTTPLLHPQILAALARAGHGSQVLISDGNFPHATARGPNAEIVFLNLRPGLVSVTDVLAPLTKTIPIESATVMAVNKKGPYAMKTNPPIWKEFTKLLKPTDSRGQLTQLERHTFYNAARSPDVCLTIATADQAIYANLLLTIGVVR